MSLFDDKWAKFKKRQSRYPVPSTKLQSSASVKIVKVKRPRCIGMKISREKEYFWGKAGLMRVVTLILAVVAMGLGFPGYQAHHDYREKQLYVGYGESPLITSSIVLNLLCILVSYVFITMLLVFADVRCKPKWDYRNMVTCVFQCILMIASGLCQVVGTQRARVSNCRFASSTDCRPDTYGHHVRTAMDYASAYRPRYYQFHYAAWLLKIFTAIMYCVCARICLKNDD